MEDTSLYSLLLWGTGCFQNLSKHLTADQQESQQMLKLKYHQHRERLKVGFLVLKTVPVVQHLLTYLSVLVYSS